MNSSLTPLLEQPSWQQILAAAITDPAELCQILNLPLSVISQQAILDFGLRVPRGFVSRMEKSNPNDPLLQQILPQQQEVALTPGYTHDPLQEKQSNPIPGLLHKYANRVLLLLAGKCAVNCRYCFRRHFPYLENMPGTKGWQNSLDYIAADSSITEVIYSGGDPLLLKDEQLASLTQKIAAIPHVSLLRIHTRLPIVIPERITTTFINWLTNSRLQPIVVIHCNHPNEINHTVAHAIQRLRDAGVTVLNQTVLLKGINDDADVLISLSKKLFSTGVLPYYLHVLDTVQGAAHFSVPFSKINDLQKKLLQQLPGYLIPKFVQEKPGVGHKSLFL